MPLIEERVTVSLKKILLVTDFSQASDKAAAYAKGLARRFASTVEVTHILDPSAVITYEEFKCIVTRKGWLIPQLENKFSGIIALSLNNPGTSRLRKLRPPVSKPQPVRVRQGQTYRPEP